MLKPMFKPTVRTRTKLSAVVFAPVFFTPLGATCCVSVLLSDVGVQQVLGSTPTAVAMPLCCMCLSLSFHSPDKVLFCSSISAAKIDSFGCHPFYP